MENFKLVKQGLGLDAVRRELRESDLWVDMDSLPGRAQTHMHSHRIQLRVNAKVPGKTYHDIHETRDLPAWRTLTVTRQLILDFLREAGGVLGHVRVSRLDPSAEIVPHVDIGEYCAIRDRYHVVIESAKGTQFVAGSESVIMHENELWWFDNKKRHSVKNLGDTPRIHLVFDILPDRDGSKTS